eukprot:TRINITY_DN1866_c5_g1_i2.p1 TRINITY_DN1866_c5_g1~~TRINITY_DN1866_c5_g1_i2.p1  ORF type:complete len:685 (-),score=168.99 TRINITY_DN1866_c5_g1_i2:197-2251(-)
MLPWRPGLLEGDLRRGVERPSLAEDTWQELFGRDVLAINAKLAEIAEGQRDLRAALKLGSCRFPHIVGGGPSSNGENDAWRDRGLKLADKVHEKEECPVAGIPSDGRLRQSSAAAPTSGDCKKVELIVPPPSGGQSPPCSSSPFSSPAKSKEMGRSASMGVRFASGRSRSRSSLTEDLPDGSKPGRSSFNAVRTEAEDKSELRYVFERAEFLQVEAQENRTFMQRWKKMTREEFELMVDSVVGLVVCLNALFIGISMDAAPSESTRMLIIDTIFTTLFCIELSIKLFTRGFCGQFCGPEAKMNIFDALLILADLAQLSIVVFLPEETSAALEEFPSASLFRVVRLVRLVRMLRLLRNPLFESLLMMMHGMIGGLTTLGWAMLLFLTTVYLVSLLFRETLGRSQFENVYEYFNGVPRAMLTTFRCSFGDCSAAGGVPIFEHVDKYYGPQYGLLYCVFIFSMSIGLFNVISAIFVESTLAAAAGMKFRQKKARLQDEDLWASRIFLLVQKLAQHAQLPGGGTLSGRLDDVYDLDVERDVIRRIGRDPQAVAALEDLDIDPEDHENLADILDPDQGGSIAVIELVEGLHRLRGDPKRSDIVTVDLMLRSIQRTLKEVHKATVRGEEHDATKPRMSPNVSGSNLLRGCSGGSMRSGAVDGCGPARLRQEAEEAPPPLLQRGPAAQWCL